MSREVQCSAFCGVEIYCENLIVSYSLGSDLIKKIVSYSLGSDLINREKVQILDDAKYNYSKRAAQALIIGSTRKPIKSKCSKNEIMSSPQG
jgi:hypothetical protein